ncbi:hypothetical protein [Enterococcus diestrammenae]|uniref:hypothetical protein n=1 Tax=Enterococcus diestrammenae TaxID=1155073 RepID=UPI0022E77895|nr:hypothetical protein [Enterococcus diestrammenae]
MINFIIKPSVNRYVGKEVKQYIDWINSTMSFPKNVTIDITGSSYVYNSITTEKVAGTFFGPYSNSTLVPYIKIATGDFFQAVDKYGIDKAKLDLYNILSHEIVHFIQWLDDAPYDEAQAESQAEKISDCYFIFLEKKSVIS